jgi:hypothetical protein
MDLRLERREANSNGIFGVLIDVHGQEVAYTLEHSYSENGTYVPKLPIGIYACVIGEHQLSTGGPQQLYEVTGIEGHTGILFHKGNYNRDSNGCILLGTSVGNGFISRSQAAFDKFMQLQNGKPFILIVS